MPRIKGFGGSDYLMHKGPNLIYVLKSSDLELSTHIYNIIFGSFNAQKNFSLEFSLH